MVSSLKQTYISGHHRLQSQEPPHQDSLAEAPDQSNAGADSKPKKKFATKMRSIVSAVKTAQRLEVSSLGVGIMLVLLCNLVHFFTQFNFNVNQVLLNSLYCQRSLHRATDATFVPKYASENIIRSGHLDYNTLFASNEQQVKGEKS